MKEFTIEHIYCGMITHIEGYDFYDAMRSNNKDLKYWKEI